MDNNQLSWLSRNTTTKQRIWFGFILSLVTFALVSFNSLSQFSSLSSGIYRVTEKIQPAVLSAQNLAFQLESANNALGFYMLTKEAPYKDQYMRSMSEVRIVLDSLQTDEHISSKTEYQTRVQQIVEYISQLNNYIEQIVGLVNNDLLNLPAMQIATEKLNPMAQQMQSLINQMILSEWEEENIDGSRSEFIQSLYDTRYYNVQLLSELRTFLAFRNKTSIANITSISEVLDSKIAALTAAQDKFTFEQAEAIPEYQKISTRYKKALNEALAVHSTSKYRKDIYLTKTEIGPIIVNSQNKLMRLVNLLRNEITHESTALQRNALAARTRLITGISLGIFIGIAIAFSIVRMITIPINEAVDAIEDLADGAGDLTRRLNADGKSEISKMSGGFNRFASKVHKLVTQVAEGVQNLALVVKDLSSIVDQTQQGSQQQSTQTEKTAIAISAMTKTAHEVSVNANLAADSARQADDDAKTGQTVVADTIQSINELAFEIEQGANVINELEKDTKSIGSVLDVIKSISEQTNLLALNAAIEAARAGEQGRGFAVVADEVRILASRTQASATEIQSMIQSLQVQAHAAVEAISRGQEKARNSVSNALSAGIALSDITSSVAIISSMNIQIASSSKQQNLVADHINQNVVEIRQVADNNALAAGKLATSSNALAVLADDLRSLISQYKY